MPLLFDQEPSIGMVFSISITVASLSLFVQYIQLLLYLVLDHHTQT